MKWCLSILSVIGFSSLVSCGGSSENGDGSGSIGDNQSYVISGTVLGLSGSIELTMGSESIEIDQDGTYIFENPVLNGSRYKISITRQPDTRYCTIENATGVISGAAITNIQVNCFDRLMLRLNTSLGEIYIHPSDSTWPIQTHSGLASFIKQIVNGVYNNSVIHRVIPGYLIQGGEFNESFNHIAPVETIDIDYSSRYINNPQTVSLLKTNSNNTPGFFFNLDYNNHLDINNNDGYLVVGTLNAYSRTQETINKILNTPRETASFDGPVDEPMPTDKIVFQGILSTGTLDYNYDPIHRINNVHVYDSQGNTKTLNFEFELINIFGLHWQIRVTDNSNTINETIDINYSSSGGILDGSLVNIINPASNGGIDTSIELDLSNTMSLSSGNSSYLVIKDVNGRPSPTGDEKPINSITIQSAELLGRNRALENPADSYTLALAGNILLNDTQMDFEIEYYLGDKTSYFGPEPTVDNSGHEILMKISFTNEGHIQPRQWRMEVYHSKNSILEPDVRTLQFDVNGNLTPQSHNTVVFTNLRHLYNTRLSFSNLTSKDTGTTSNVFFETNDGNSLWNQYMPISLSAYQTLEN